jgi:hypothetical protein
MPSGLSTRKRYVRRSWWTKERVREGLRRFHSELGESPTWKMSYYQMLKAQGQGRGRQRRYPPPDAVLRYWPSFVEAWREAGVELRGVRTGHLSEPGMELNWVRDRSGEPHGRLTVLHLVGHRQRAADSISLWLCRCECGNYRTVEAGRFNSIRECEDCAHERRKTGKGRFKWVRTAKIDARLVELFEGGAAGRKALAAACAKEMGWPLHMIYIRARELGLGRKAA